MPYDMVAFLEALGIHAFTRPTMSPSALAQPGVFICRQKRTSNAQLFLRVVTKQDFHHAGTIVGEIFFVKRLS